MGGKSLLGWEWMQHQTTHTELKNREAGEAAGLRLDLEWAQLQLKCGPSSPRRHRKEARSRNQEARPQGLTPSFSNYYSSLGLGLADL